MLRPRTQRESLLVRLYCLLYCFGNVALLFMDHPGEDVRHRVLRFALRASASLAQRLIWPSRLGVDPPERHIRVWYEPGSNSSALRKARAVRATLDTLGV